MIRFFILGLWRDKNRSLLPVIVVAAGVMLTVMIQTWVTGVMGDMMETNAQFFTGHVKVATKASFENTGQISNEYALGDINALQTRLSEDYPDVEWVVRTHFGGLIDVPDSNGETKAQGPAIGFGIDLLSGSMTEIERMNIPDAIVSGQIPSKSGEALISNDFAQRTGVKIGDDVSLISSTMHGSMAVATFRVAGTVNFGIGAIDRGAIIADVNDVSLAFDMDDAAGEVLGFTGPVYDNEEAIALAASFNAAFPSGDDEFAPEMKALHDQNDLGGMIDYAGSMIGLIIFVFVVAMSIVLWNAGLLGGLRRYGEMGMRLAIGETKGHVYRTLVYESIFVGIAGTVLGTAIALAISYPIQNHGIDFSSFMKNTSMLIPAVFRTRISALSFYVGFFPGLFSTVIGAMLAGIGIFKRQTSELFKELSV